MQSNILILTYWSYEDALIQTYTLPYVRIIRRLLPFDKSITLLTLEKTSLRDIDRSFIRNELQAEGIGWIHQRYRRFGLLAAVHWFGWLIRLILVIRRGKIGMIHCWGMPAGAAGVMLSMITRTPLLIDSYEPHAEAMVENGTWRRGSIAFRLLFFLEKWQTRRAVHLVATHGGMVQYAREKYGVSVKHLVVKPACVDTETFKPAVTKDASLLRELGLEDKIVAVYAGKLGGIYLDREVFEFLKTAHTLWGDQLRALLLTNQPEDEICGWCNGVGLPREVVVVRFVPHRQVPGYLALADFALTPVKPVPTKRYCTPIKDGEYWAMGLPVVIPADISEDSEIIRREKIGAVLDELNATAYRAALDEINVLLNKPRMEVQERIRAIALKYRDFSIAENVYSSIYGR
jgi:glycosyltransferase involved in cell wall biosynthesis